MGLPRRLTVLLRYPKRGLRYRYFISAGITGDAFDHFAVAVTSGKGHVLINLRRIANQCLFHQTLQNNQMEYTAILTRSKKVCQSCVFRVRKLRMQFSVRMSEFS